MEQTTSHNKTECENEEIDDNLLNVDDRTTRRRKIGIKNFLQRRYLVAMTLFSATIIIKLCSTCLSMAIVPMTTERPVVLENGSTIHMKEFDWSTKEIGLILSAEYYPLGYVITIIAGWLTTKWGGLRIIGISVFVSTATALATPFVAYKGVYYLYIMKAATGLFRGAVYPGIHSVLACWTPTNERSRTVSFIFTSPFITPVISTPLFGFAIYHFGWNTVFYFSGFLGICWLVVCLSSIKRYPSDDPKISQEELDYIKNSLGNGGSSEKNVSVEWCSMLKCKALWAILICIFSDYFMSAFLDTVLPLFLTDITHYNIEDIGFINGFMHLGIPVAIILSGFVGDYLINAGILSVTKTRKYMICISLFGEGIIMLITSQVRAPLFSIILFTIGGFFQGFCTGTLQVNILDVSGEFSGITAAIKSSSIFLAFFLVPNIVAFTVNRSENEKQWYIIFLISGIISIIGAFVYAVFGSGELQKWAKIRTR